MTEQEIESPVEAPESAPSDGDDPFDVSTETTVPQTDEETPKNDEVPA